YIKVREGGRVLSMALVVAVGVKETGEREVLGFDVGLSEDGPFWTEFLRSLVRRGLKDVLLVISDAHEGLKEAIRKVLGGSSWQRCRVPFLCNLVSQVPKGAKQMVAAFVRPTFAQPDKAAHAQLANVADSLEQPFPKAAQMLREAAEDILAYIAFPGEHWRQLHSTNPLERLMRE